MCVNAVFSEFDSRPGLSKHRLAQHIASFEFPPSIIVDSGGGYHCYWLLDKTFSVSSGSALDRITKLQYNWVEYTKGDCGAKDLCRVLRLPGFRNLKQVYAPSFPVVSVEYLKPNVRYCIKDLEEKLPVREDKGPAALVTDIHDIEAYITNAVSGEVCKVSTAQEGSRNTTLVRSAFKLGQLIGPGLTDRQVHIALMNAARSCGLPDREAAATITRGVFHGKKNTRRSDAQSMGNAQQMDIQG